MFLRIGKDKENEITAIFRDPAFNPSKAFTANTPDAAMFDDALLDPGLLVSQLALSPAQLARHGAEMALNNTLRQQQYLVYDVGSRVGVLAPFVGALQNSLQAYDVILSSLNEEDAWREAITTSIGVGASALSAVPTIYTQIAGAVVSVGLWIADLFIKYQAAIPTNIPLIQDPEKDTDVGQFNHGVRPILQSGFDWTLLFSPRFSGDLAGQVRVEGDTGRLVLAFAPGDGRIARVGVSGRGKKRKATFPDSGVFNPSGGLGFIPGGQRILSVVQVMATEAPEGPQGGHETIFDPRCGSIDKARGVDVGSWYPVTSQGVMSLWDFLWQRGAAMYTIDCEKAEDEWRRYFDSIWAGVERTWGQKKWRGDSDTPGWGCGFWENALQQLVSNYTMGINDAIGGPMSWRPTNIGSDNQKRLASNSDELWDQYNAFTNVIRPALRRLKKAQDWYLENTTMAAYLPVYGGRNANPLQPNRGGVNEGAVLGAFIRNSAMRDMFVNARNRIINGTSKYDVRLRDVLDADYRSEIRNSGGGTQALELGFAATPLPGEPTPFTPEGGIGLADEPRDPPPPVHRRQVWPYVAGGVAVAGATAAAAYYWDDLSRILGSAGRRLPASIRALPGRVRRR